MEEREYLELREWAPTLTDLWDRVPATISKSFILKEDVTINCIDAVENFLALGSTGAIIFWYNRASKQMTQLKCPSPASTLTAIKIVSSVEYLVAAGDSLGNVFIFQIPKEIPQDLLNLSGIAAGGKGAHPKQNHQYSVRELHTGPVRCLEWSKNGMKLFSGDKFGNIVLTELDLVKNEISSSVILNEAYEIVQIRFQQPKWLLISSIFRTVICEKSDINHWRLRQVGTKDRKLLSLCGGTFLSADQRPPTIICSRPGGRFWIANVEGTVQKTLVYKDIFEARRPDVPLVNPSRKFMKIINEFQRLHSYLDDYCVTSNADAVFVLNLKMNRVEATVKYLRGVLDVAVEREEIFILEGPRSILRIAPNPDTYSDAPSYNSPVTMSSIQSTSLYDPPAVHNQSEPDDQEDVAGGGDASECKELTPIEHLDIDRLLLDAWPTQEVSGEAGEEGPKEEHAKKMQLFDRINQETFDENILFRSRRLKVIEATSPSVEQKGIVEIAQLARADTEEDEDKEVVVVEEIERILIENEKQEENQTPLPPVISVESAAQTENNDMKESSSSSCDIIVGEMEESVLTEILTYSARFVSDDNLRELVNGITNGWRGVTPSPSDRAYELELIYGAGCRNAVVTEFYQGYWDEEEEEVEEENIVEEEQRHLMENGWVFVTQDDCREDDLSDADSDWEVVEDDLGDGELS